MYNDIEESMRGLYFESGIQITDKCRYCRGRISIRKVGKNIVIQHKRFFVKDTTVLSWTDMYNWQSLASCVFHNRIYLPPLMKGFPEGLPDTGFRSTND